MREGLHGNPLSAAGPGHALDGEIPEISVSRQAIGILFGKRWLRSKDDVSVLPGAQLIPEQGAFLGVNPAIYAFTKVATHRNIYRITVP